MFKKIVTSILMFVSLEATAQTDTVPNEPSGEVIILKEADVFPEFPGGNSAWARFLGKKINSNVPLKRKAPVGRYTVRIKFTINKEGIVESPVALSNHGYGMEEEAIRVLMLSPRWKPGVQGNKKVSVYMMQPISFVVPAK